MRSGHGRKLIGAAAAAAVSVATISAFWSAAGSAAGPRPLAEGSSPKVTKASWAAVPFGPAQLSVPGGWCVQDSREVLCLGKIPGQIFAGLRPLFAIKLGAGKPVNYAWIVPVKHFPAGISHRKPTAVINGLPVFRKHDADGSLAYLVPKLGVEVGAHGRLARRIIATLARSPLDVVLAKGPASPAPKRWVRREFGGVRFATPRGWRRHLETQFSTCGTGVWPGQLLLVDARKPPLEPPCLPPLSTASDDAAEPGLVVLTGKYAAESVAEHYPHCRTRQHTKICWSQDTGVAGLLGGVLMISVSRPHHHSGTFFLLGLAGSGAKARTIFDSISVG